MAFKLLDAGSELGHLIFLRRSALFLFVLAAQQGLQLLAGRNFLVLAGDQLGLCLCQEPFKFLLGLQAAIGLFLQLRLQLANAGAQLLVFFILLGQLPAAFLLAGEQGLQLLLGGLFLLLTGCQIRIHRCQLGFKLLQTLILLADLLLQLGLQGLDFRLLVGMRACCLLKTVQVAAQLFNLLVACGNPFLSLIQRSAARCQLITQPGDFLVLVQKRRCRFEQIQLCAQTFLDIEQLFDLLFFLRQFLFQGLYRFNYNFSLRRRHRQRSGTA